MIIMKARRWIGYDESLIILFGQKDDNHVMDVITYRISCTIVN